MRVITVCFGPGALDGLTAYMSVFSHDFKRFDRINYHPQSGWFEDAPLKGIRMKLSVDSLDQSAGFVLFCQTLSEYVGRRVSFA